jgi:hypothetical protein
MRMLYTTGLLMMYETSIEGAQGIRYPTPVLTIVGSIINIDRKWWSSKSQKCTERMFRRNTTYYRDGTPSHCDQRDGISAVDKHGYLS